jgi:hypothetical protein
MPRKTKSKTARIVTWLSAGKTINPLSALKNFGVFRLASIIHYLRTNRGMKITTDTSKGYATYKLSN